jgi:large subunit ribosomal protein L10
MERQTKIDTVKRMREELDGVRSVFLCNFNGLTVEKDTQLRAKMRESGARYTVVKNTLLKLAFAETDFEKVNDQLVGNTALAYNEEDLIGLAKLIRDFAKENNAFQFKGGVVEGKAISVDDLDALAKMPSREELVAKMMYMLNYPVQGLAVALSGITRNFVVVLDQIKQKKEEEN